MATRHKAVPFVIHLLSDSTGNLPKHMVNAILTQFRRRNFTVKTHVNLDSPEKIERSLKKIVKRKTMVMHAFVDPDIKQRVDHYLDRKNIPHYDMTGSMVQFVADHTGLKPRNDLSRLHRVDEGYHQRIAAMEFTAQHDDNQRIETAREADVVILGASRMSKSPTSTYLGFMGYKVANIALAPQMEPPKELSKIRRARMIGFTMQPKRLSEIRAMRFRSHDEQIADKQHPDLGYSDLRAVIKEIVWLESLYKKLGIQVLDVTEHTIEETAARIVQRLGL